MRLKYNAPVTLTFTLISATVHVINAFGLPINYFFTAPANLINAGLPEYLGIFTHIFGHKDWEHFLSNFSFILLLGPILEEKYGGKKILLMIIITALFTGIFNVIFISQGLLGASGIVFMFILLSSITNYKSGDIPITFLLIVVLYLGKEIWQMVTSADQVAQYAHILGGVFGAIFGFIINKKVIQSGEVLTPDIVEVKKKEKPKQKEITTIIPDDVPYIAPKNDSNLPENF